MARTKEEVETIINDYKAGSSTADIASKLNISTTKVRSVLKDEGVELRHSRSTKVVKLKEATEDTKVVDASEEENKDDYAQLYMDFIEKHQGELKERIEEVGSVTEFTSLDYSSLILRDQKSDKIVGSASYSVLNIGTRHYRINTIDVLIPKEDENDNYLNIFERLFLSAVSATAAKEINFGFDITSDTKEVISTYGNLSKDGIFHVN